MFLKTQKGNILLNLKNVVKIQKLENTKKIVITTTNNEEYIVGEFENSETLTSVFEKIETQILMFSGIVEVKK